MMQAKPGMIKSAVVDNASGKSVDSDIRTSTGTFFSLGEDDIIKEIEKRVAQVTMIPLGEWGGRPERGASTTACLCMCMCMLPPLPLTV